MMIYTMHENTSKRMIVLLHGTGGDEYDLLEVGQYIDPDAILIGIRGAVQEHGMNRYFKKKPDGTFDEANLEEETVKLYQQIQELRRPDHIVTILGYSNGANITQNILKTMQPAYDNVLLLHPSLVRAHVPYLPQKQTAVFVSGGVNDPYLSLEQFTGLKRQLEEADIRYEAYISPQGHQLLREELTAAREWYQTQIKQKK